MVAKIVIGFITLQVCDSPAAIVPVASGQSPVNDVGKSKKKAPWVISNKSLEAFKNDFQC